MTKQKYGIALSRDSQILLYAGVMLLGIACVSIVRDIHGWFDIARLLVMFCGIVVLLSGRKTIVETDGDCLRIRCGLRSNRVPLDAIEEACIVAHGPASRVTGKRWAFAWGQKRNGWFSGLTGRSLFVAGQGQHYLYCRTLDRDFYLAIQNPGFESFASDIVKRCGQQKNAA